MNKNLLIYFPIILFIFLSCNKDNPAGSDLYVPQLPDQWHEENVPTHTFLLSSGDNGSNRGNFTGKENYPELNFVDCQITGSFNNRSIEFNIDRVNAGMVRFSGTIVSDNRIEVSSIREQLVLVK